MKKRAQIGNVNKLLLLLILTQEQLFGYSLEHQEKY